MGREGGVSPPRNDSRESMRKEDGAPTLPDASLTCLAMECVQAAPLQQPQQGKIVEGDHLLLLLPPPPAVAKEEETLLRSSNPWAASQDSSQSGTELQGALDFPAHLPDSHRFQHNPPALGNYPGGDTADLSVVHSLKEDSKETVSCDGAENQLQPPGKETLSHPLQEESPASEVTCSNPSLVVVTAQECLRDTEKPSQQSNHLQEKSNSASQNCSLGLEATGRENPGDNQSGQASPSVEDGKLKPGAKHVTFPSDEDIVSGAVEPKDPWRHGE